MIATIHKNKKKLKNKTHLIAIDKLNSFPKSVLFNASALIRLSRGLISFVIYCPNCMVQLKKKIDTKGEFHDRVHAARNFT